WPMGVVLALAAMGPLCGRGVRGQSADGFAEVATIRSNGPVVVARDAAIGLTRITIPTEAGPVTIEVIGEPGGPLPTPTPTPTPIPEPAPPDPPAPPAPPTPPTPPTPPAPHSEMEAAARTYVQVVPMA